VLGDILEVKLFGVCNSIDTLNVFYYANVAHAGGSTSDISALSEAFGTVLVPQIAAPLTNAAHFSLVTVAYAIEPDLIDSFIVDVSGGGESETLPVFNAIGFRYERTSVNVRSGAKRFAGVPEDGQNAGVITPTYQTTCETLATQLGAILTWPDPVPTYGFAPVILSRYLDGALRVPPVAYDIAGVTFTGITSQNTRKS